MRREGSQPIEDRIRIMQAVLMAIAANYLPYAYVLFMSGTAFWENVRFFTIAPGGVVASAIHAHLLIAIIIMLTFLTGSVVLILHYWQQRVMIALLIGVFHVLASFAAFAQGMRAMH